MVITNMKMRVISSKDTVPYVPVNTDASKKIVSSEFQEKAVITDKKTGAFVLETSTVETSVIDTKQYINSFKDDVGIANILKKFNLVNDSSLFNQVNRPTVPIEEDGKEAVQDYTGLPKTEEEAFNIARKAKAEFGNLPQELVKGRSFIEFAESCTKDELLAFIASQNKKDGE